MMRILLPTDFSDNAFNAIKYGLKLFKNKECTFYLLNTYTPIIYNYDFQMEVAGGLGKVRDIIKNNSVDQLENLKTKLIKNYPSVKHSFEIISSFNTLTQEIKEKVENLNIDLIIMGTKGASGLKEVLFGSNTIHIIKSRVSPVLAVPDAYFFEAPKNILFPTDFGIDYNENHLKPIKTIAKFYDSELHVLHATTNSDLTKKEKSNRQKLETLLNGTDFKIHIVSDQSVTNAINEFQNSHYIQLLMMINNKHSFFENLFFKPVINQIGFQLTTPFLVIPSKL